jgi:c-di-GMP-binding flagellar brake protein YcgR
MERRRFFRIDDRISISIERQIDEQAHETEYEQHVEQLQIDQELNHIIADLRVHHPEIAHAVELLNRKMHILFQTQDGSPESEAILTDINISACGLAIPWPESFQLGESLTLHLYLHHPSHEYLRVQGKLVRIDQPEAGSEDQNVTLRIDFVDLEEPLQERLIQYVVQRQAKQLHKQLEIKAARVEPVTTQPSKTAHAPKNKGCEDQMPEKKAPEDKKPS